MDGDKENNTNLDFDFGLIKNIQEETAKYSQLNSESQANKLNPFPVDAFPDSIQQIIRATNESLYFPIDFIGASMLYAVSLAIGNTYRVQVKKGWQESAVLFITNVGEPGTNKSHPLSFALQPLYDKQEQNFKIYENRKTEYDRASKLTEEERRMQNINEPVKPFWEKHTVSDFTPEALNEVHKFNKRGIGVCVDELAGWFKNFNRYHKGAEQEFWLSAWSNKQITIDRKKDEPIFIPLPFIPVGGNIQPGILIELAKDRTQNGFIDRILFAFPPELKKPEWSENEIDDVIVENWKNIILNLLNIELKLNENLHPKPEILKFSSDAYNKIKEWVKQNTALINNAESAALKGIYGKLEIYAFRLSLILEMMNWACKGDEEPVHEVTLKSVAGALQLLEYFRTTAEKVNSIISNFNPLDKLPADKQRLYLALPDAFTTAEGLQIAELQGIPKDTFHKWLSRETRVLFKKVKKGEYEKLI